MGVKTNFGQTDFSGGMVDAIPTDRIPENAYVLSENMEIDEGILKSRRPHEVIFEGIPDGGRLIGSGIYYVGDVAYPVVALRAADGSSSTYFIDLASQAATQITPGFATIGASEYTFEKDSVVFCQYGTRFYMIRRDEEGAVYSWDGVTSDPEWTALPSVDPGTTGTEWCPKSRLMKSAYGRTWIVVRNEGSSAFDCINASDIMLDSGVLAWDVAEHNWRIGSGEQTDITAIEEYPGGSLLVFKEGSVWVLHECNGDLADFWIEQISSFSGAVGARAVCKAGTDVLYVSGDGVRTVNTDIQNNARAQVEPLSYRIGKLWRERLNLSTVERYLMCAICHSGRVFITVSQGYGGRINGILVYNVKYSCWESLWSSIGSIHLEQFKHLGIESLIGIGDNGVVSLLNSPARYGVNTVFQSSVRTRSFTSGELESTKTFKRMMFGFSGERVTLKVDAIDCDSEKGVTVFSETIGTENAGVLYIPDEGLYIPDEGIEIGEVMNERFLCWIGCAARGIGFVFSCLGGAWDLRSVSYESADHGRKFKEF